MLRERLRQREQLEDVAVRAVAEQRPRSAIAAAAPRVLAEVSEARRVGLGLAQLTGGGGQAVISVSSAEM